MPCAQFLASKIVCLQNKFIETQAWWPSSTKSRGDGKFCKTPEVWVNLDFVTRCSWHTLPQFSTSLVVPFSPGQDSREVVRFSDVSDTPWWETLQLSYSSLKQFPEDRSAPMEF